MIPEIILATIELVALTKLDGRVAYVNPASVIRLEETSTGAGREHNKQFTDEVRCVVVLSGGEYVAVRESCGEVRRLFVAAEEGR